MHWLVPVPVEYVPCAHVEHAPIPSDEYLPGLQAPQAVDVVEPVTLTNLPAMQLLHAEAASVALYLPMAHAAHEADDVAPSESLYLPLPHGLHVLDKLAALVAE